ncbi:cytosolic Fe-S cluster assembly factor NUBP2 isoform X2 [Phyllostomus hastatus]|uniref:cytosolic Fe-S cluster assembly factor NUBP2 isoform X2 n=1 Tax=Phyllostomus hastatus TaxID=9423 RepID=UPI001E680D83|nr:cytosolic Fe-S cluster assembly factor NUBP2 isoform X2 [Phyllostomus hastatus]
MGLSSGWRRVERERKREREGERRSRRPYCNLQRGWRRRRVSVRSLEMVGRSRPASASQDSGVWKLGWRPAHHPNPLWKGGGREKHHLHGAGPGPASHGQKALIKQFVSDVAWGQLDYLVVDTPPGTSDEHMAALDALRPYSPLGAVVVTTPQAVSVGDVRRELTFCRKTGLRVIGIVENMSGFVCPHCTECTNVFSRGGGEELAKHAGVPFLGSVPLDPELTRCLEEGRDFMQEFPQSPAFHALSAIAQKILKETPAQLS